MPPVDDLEPIVLGVLEPDETLHALARARGATLMVTDRRVVIVDEGRTILDVPTVSVRRIEFDAEHDRPATLVIVPERPEHEPQVLVIEAVELSRTCEALVHIARGLNGQPGQGEEARPGSPGTAGHG